jgi:hypothetical protein
MRKFWRWLKDNQPPISAISSVFTVIGVCIAIFGFVIAGKQFEQAVRSLRSSTVYNLQKDGRDLLTNIRKEDPEVYRYIMQGEKTQNEEALYRRAMPYLTLFIQYYSTVFNQRQIGSIPDPMWDSISAEMCAFFKSPPIKRFWKERVVEGRYDKDFKAFGQKCVDAD